MLSSQILTLTVAVAEYYSSPLAKLLVRNIKETEKHLSCVIENPDNIRRGIGCEWSQIRNGYLKPNANKWRYLRCIILTHREAARGDPLLGSVEEWSERGAKTSTDRYSDQVCLEYYINRIDIRYKQTF